jgi:hypothetical protein
MYESGNEEALPNLFSFVTLIHAVVKSGQPGAAQRAEKLVFEMYDQYLQGNAYAKPNTQLVTAVIDCWQKSGDRDAGEKAEALLNWLVDLYEKEQDESLRPNEFTFTSGKKRTSLSRRYKLFRSLVLHSPDVFSIQQSPRGANQENSARP